MMMRTPNFGDVVSFEIGDTSHLVDHQRMEILDSVLVFSFCLMAWPYKTLFRLHLNP